MNFLSYSVQISKFTNVLLNCIPQLTVTADLSLKVPLINYQLQEMLQIQTMNLPTHTMNCQ